MIMKWKLEKCLYTIYNCFYFCSFRMSRTVLLFRFFGVFTVLLITKISKRMSKRVQWKELSIHIQFKFHKIHIFSFTLIVTDVCRHQYYKYAHHIIVHNNGYNNIVCEYLKKISYHSELVNSTILFFIKSVVKYIKIALTSFIVYKWDVIVIEI